MKSNQFTLFLALAFAAFPLFASTEVQHDFDAAIAATGIQRVFVDLPEAGITIRTTSADRIDVSGRARRGYRNDEQRRDAQRMVDHSSIEVVVDGTLATVRRRFGANAQKRTARGGLTKFELTLVIPEKTNIQVRMKGGEVDAAGLFGHVDIGITAGAVTLKVPKSSVKELMARSRVGDVKINLGDRIVEKQGLFAGKAHYLNEGGASVVSVMLSAGDASIELTR